MTVAYLIDGPAAGRLVAVKDGETTFPVLEAHTVDMLSPDVQNDLATVRWTEHIYDLRRTYWRHQVIGWIGFIGLGNYYLWLDSFDAWAGFVSLVTGGPRF